VVTPFIWAHPPVILAIFVLFIYCSACPRHSKHRASLKRHLSFYLSESESHDLKGCLVKFSTRDKEVPDKEILFYYIMLWKISTENMKSI
jgi:hypothetical protein